MRSVSIIGTSKFDSHLCSVAETVGSILAKKGFVLISGGLSGVMEYSFKGAKKENGLTIGIIPSYNKNDANKYCDIIIPTGLGHSRNVLVASSGDIVISIGGELGTISEIAIALKLNKDVVSYNSPLNHKNNFCNVETFITKINDLT